MSTVVAAEQLALRRIRPVIGWAITGVCFALFGTALLVAWFVAGDAHHVGTGADRVPTSTGVLVIVFEVTAVLGAIWAIAHSVRTTKERGRLSLDAMIVIAWALAWWHDPIIGWLRPTVFYNAAYVNLGSWTNQIPGWISPNSRYLPEPILGIGAIYLSLALGFSILGCAVMDALRRRSPRIGPVGLVLGAFLAIFVGEFLTEVLVIATHLIGYPSSFPALTLFAGTTHQIPVYEQVLWSVVLTATAALRYFTSPDGRSAVERGADRVTLGTRGRSLLCLAAVVGFVNVTCVTYDAAMIVSSLYAGHTQLYPTYLRTAQCGPGTSVPCPGPGVPIVHGSR